MPAAATPPDEAGRIAALRSLEILDTAPEEEFDALVRLAAQICGTPIALVSLIDESRQWFKAKVGIGAVETGRDAAYCAHAILEDETLIVPDAARDPRFADSPLRTGDPRAEFYAGVPLRTREGHALGTLCVIDHAPRSLTEPQRTALEALAAQAMRLLELRRATNQQRAALADLREDTAPTDETTARWSRTAVALASVIAASTLALFGYLRSEIAAAEVLRLQSGADRAGTFIEERVRGHIAILRGAGALFGASKHVSPNEFRAYAAALELRAHYPGLLGLGYAEQVEPAGLDAWLDDTRVEIPGFRVVTSGQAPRMIINKLIEPLAENLSAVGFDVLSDALRSEALRRAERTGAPAASAQVGLLQDPKHGPGVLVYLPVGARPELAAGFVFAAMRVRDLVTGVREAAGHDVDVRLVDPAERVPLLGAAAVVGPARVTRPVLLADRRLVLEVRGGQTSVELSQRALPWLLLCGGALATALTIALAGTIRRIEARSRAIARRMTSTLREDERTLRAANAALERLATTDALTATANRRAFDEHLAQEIARARRGGPALGLILLDVDHFKRFNDTYGHAGGDDCLRAVGRCLRPLARRAGELVARYGGEEFAIILPATSHASAWEVAEGARAAIQALAIPHAQSSPGVVTASFGLALLSPGTMPDAAALIAAADQALYRAKAGGRNRVA